MTSRDSVGDAADTADTADAADDGAAETAAGGAAGDQPHDQPHDQLREHVERHRDGSLRARGPMLGDAPHGAWEWFRLDGTIMRSGSFDRGAQVGEWTTYDRQGRPYKVTRLS